MQLQDLASSPLLNNLVYADVAPTVPVAWDAQDRRDTIMEVFIAVVVLLAIWYIMKKN